MFQHALMTWGDKMTKAEIDDIFGEFEIDEDYMIKTKEVVGLFVAVKEEAGDDSKRKRRRLKKHPLQLKRLPQRRKLVMTPRRRRRRRRRPPSKCKCSINIPISIFFINMLALVLQMSCKMINNRKQ